MPNIEPFSVDTIFDHLEEMLNKRGKVALKAIDTLLAIEQGLLQLKTERPWEHLFVRAITLSTTGRAKNQKRALELMNLRGKFYVHNHRDQEAYDSFKEMLDYAEKAGIIYFQMEAYIGLLQVHIRLPREVFDENLINQLLGATTVTSLDQKRRFCQALANYGIHEGNDQLCIAYGNIVYPELERDGNTTQMAKMAYALSQAYRLQGNLVSANQWHETAEWAFTLSGDPHAKAALAYNWGSHMLYAENYREAEYWMRVAVEECKKLNDKHGEMVIGHGLAIAIAYHDTDYREGLALLDEAVKFWQETSNTVQIAHAQHTYGFLYEKMGNHEAAVVALKNGRELFADLPVNDLNRLVLDRIEELLALIERGGSLDELSPRGK